MAPREVSPLIARPFVQFSGTVRARDMVKTLEEMRAKRVAKRTWVTQTGRHHAERHVLGKEAGSDVD